MYWIYSVFECNVHVLSGEYAVRFIPRENGPHLVYVSFDGCQIPDSPFRIQVGTVHADPGMVQAYGDGLRTGKTGMYYSLSLQYFSWLQLMSLGHPTHIGLQLGKACYPCSRYG